MKVVINKCFGGFGLSAEAEKLYCELTGTNPEDFSYHELARTDPVLVAVVEQLGDQVNNSYSELKIVEVPDEVEWTIQEYDGIEWVAEKHRTWH